MAKSDEERKKVASKTACDAHGQKSGKTRVLLFFSLFGFLFFSLSVKMIFPIQIF